MALPIIAAPTYSTEIPSTKETISYRPFLVKEEKALLIAQQSEDPVTMVNTLKGVINSCTLGSVDANKLSLFDIEFLFSQIRAKSVGEIVPLIFKCDTCTDEKAKVKIDIDLTKLKVDIPEGHTNNIQLFGDVGVVMRYPSIDIITKLEKLNNEDIESVFKVICSCVDMIYQGEEIYYTNELKYEEIEQFVNNLTQDQFKQLQKFFETMPKLKHDVDYDCPLCDKHHKVTLEGLENFFS